MLIIPLSFLLDKHAPVITKFCSRKSKSNPWFTSTLRAFKSTVRRAENIWKRTHSALDWFSFKSLRNRYNNLILGGSTSSSDNHRRLWQTNNKLLHHNSSHLYLPALQPVLSQSLASFFTDKISKLRLSLTSSSISSSPHSPSSPKTPSDFSTLNLLLNLKSLKSYSIVPTNNVIPILFLPGFSKNALHS